MSEKGTGQTKELADIIVEKFRTLVNLESKILDTTEEIDRIAADRDNTELSNLQQNSIAEQENILTQLVSELKVCLEEMDTIMEELQLATPSFRTYILPQITEMVRTFKSCDATEQIELSQLVAALIDAKSSQALEQLETIIVTRLRDNLEKNFDI
ncbi:hypothetical protein C6496_00820 [Candidatus Poribacteria bacterium]|nr:MAG: hypothetical protein C6496_00820 [Candidatus Poribacteria bacterium]